ncbi:MAG: hypothetical protein R6U98_07505, partial [Pirellulaceae bacterium]
MAAPTTGAGKSQGSSPTEQCEICKNSNIRRKDVWTWHVVTTYVDPCVNKGIARAPSRKLIFDDIAPRAHLKHHDFPAIGADPGSWSDWSERSARLSAVAEGETAADAQQQKLVRYAPV